jgi:hypothetical protein
MGDTTLSGRGGYHVVGSLPYHLVGRGILRRSSPGVSLVILSGELALGGRYLFIGSGEDRYGYALNRRSLRAVLPWLESCLSHGNSQPLERCEDISYGALTCASLVHNGTIGNPTYPFILTCGVGEGDQN